MPSFVRVPKQVFVGDFSDIVTPVSGDNGKAGIWNHTLQRLEWSAFEAAGAVATHVGLSNPHTQYALTSGLGTAAYLNTGTGASQIVQLTAGGILPAVDGSLLTNLPSGGSPGGSTTQVQYNNAGAFAGDSGFTYDPATDALTVAGRVVTSVIRPASDSTTAIKIKTAADLDFVTFDTVNLDTSMLGNILLENSKYYRAKKADGTPINLFGLDNNNDLGITGPNAVQFNVASVSIQNTNTPTLNLLSSGGQLWQVLGEFGGNFNLRAGSSRRLIATAPGLFSFGSGSTPTAFVDAAASTTTAASLRIRTGVAPTTPNDGDIWQDGTNIKIRIGGATKTFTLV